MEYVFATPRLYAITPHSDYAGDMAKLASWEVAEWLSPAFPWPYKLQDAHDFILHCAEQKAKGITHNFWLIERDSKKMIGGMGCNARSKEDVEFGYWLAPAFWGRGYATEAGKKAIAHITDGLGYASLTAHTDPANYRSQNVLQKLGFQLREKKERKTPSRRGSTQDLVFTYRA